MSMVDQGANPRRLVRVASAALAVAGLLAVVLLTTQWLPVFFTRSLLRRAAIGFLVALEAAYIIGVVALLAGTFACGASCGERTVIGRNGKPGHVDYCFASALCWRWDRPNWRPACSGGGTSGPN